MRRLSRYPHAETRASMDAGPCRDMGRDLLFAKLASRVAAWPPVASHRPRIRATQVWAASGAQTRSRKLRVSAQRALLSGKRGNSRRPPSATGERRSRSAPQVANRTSLATGEATPAFALARVCCWRGWCGCRQRAASRSRGVWRTLATRPRQHRAPACTAPAPERQPGVRAGRRGSNRQQAPLRLQQPCDCRPARQSNPTAHCRRHCDARVRRGRGLAARAGSCPAMFLARARRAALAASSC